MIDQDQVMLLSAGFSSKKTIEIINLFYPSEIIHRLAEIVASDSTIYLDRDKRFFCEAGLEKNDVYKKIFELSLPFFMEASDPMVAHAIIEQFDFLGYVRDRISGDNLIGFNAQQEIMQGHVIKYNSTQSDGDRGKKILKIMTARARKPEDVIDVLGEALLVFFEETKIMTQISQDLFDKNIKSEKNSSVKPRRQSN